VEGKIPARGGESPEEPPQGLRGAEGRTNQAPGAEAGAHGPDDRQHTGGCEAKLALSTGRRPASESVARGPERTSEAICLNRFEIFTREKGKNGDP